MIPNPRTYRRLDGEVIDLTALRGEERAFLDRCFGLYRAGAPWHVLTELVRGPENPAIGPARRISRRVLDSPVYQAARDLEDRLGIIQGALLADPEDDVTSDPLEDEFLTVAQVAARKRTTPLAVRKAIERGDIVATGGRPLLVSANSLAAWTVSPARQRAGLARKSRAPISA
jgi:hypothetical protein